MTNIRHTFLSNSKVYLLSPDFLSGILALAMIALECDIPP